MKEPHEYNHYRARLRRPWFWLLPRRMWGRWVRVAWWTEYEWEWLVSKFEERFWPVEARGAALSANFEIYGRDSEEEDWEAVSEWRREQLSAARDVAVALRTQEGGRVNEKGRPGRRRGSGVDTLVRHLREKCEEVRDLDDAYWVLAHCGVRSMSATVEAWADSWPDRIRDAYDRGRVPHAGGCPYCEHGLPGEISDAVGRLKYR